MKHPYDLVEAVLREFALSYPETVEEFPWGHRAIKVKKKTFVFLSRQGNLFSLSLKLPHSHLSALMFSFAEPTGYGLGKNGWVTVSFQDSEEVPLDLMKAWIDESYRALAPKTLVKSLPSFSIAK